MARSRLRGLLAAGVLLPAGFVLQVVGVGRLSGAMGALVATAFRAAVEPALAPALSGALTELQLGMASLLSPTCQWLANLLAGNPVYDPVAIAFLWGGALWIASARVGWAVRRRSQPMLAVAPAVALLALTLACVNGRPCYLAALLLFVLMLKAVVEYQELRNRWECAKVGYSPHIRSETAWMATGLALALMIVAIIAPSVSFGRIVQVVRDLSLSEQTAGELAGSLGHAVRATVAPAAATTLILRSSGRLPANHLIGAGPQLTEELVMVVSVEYDSLVLGEHGDPNAAPPRCYWRALTYDTYTGLGWSTGVGALVSYDPGETAASVPGHPVRLVRQGGQILRDTAGSLYASGTPVTADKAFWGRLAPGARTRPSV